LPLANKMKLICALLTKPSVPKLLFSYRLGSLIINEFILFVRSHKQILYVVLLKPWGLDPKRRTNASQAKVENLKTKKNKTFFLKPFCFGRKTGCRPI
jgi:hypothetical protein